MVRSSRGVHLCGSHEPDQLHLACALEQLDATRPCIVSTDDRARVATLALDNNTRKALDKLLVPEAIARRRSGQYTPEGSCRAYAMIRLGGACGTGLVRGLLLMVVSTQQDWDTAAWHVQVARHRLAARVG